MKRLFLVLLLAAVAAVGFATPQSEARVLHIYTAFDTEEAQYYIEAFEKQTGIDVEWVRMSSGEVLARGVQHIPHQRGQQGPSGSVSSQDRFPAPTAASRR